MSSSLPAKTSQIVPKNFRRFCPLPQKVEKHMEGLSVDIRVALNQSMCTANGVVSQVFDFLNRFTPAQIVHVIVSMQLCCIMRECDLFGSVTRLIQTA
jgi:hypothetical protein